MKNRENNRYFKLGITGIAVILVGIAVVFLLTKLNVLAGICQSVLKILMPFLYGAVIAYLLAPLCNRIERWLKKLMPKRGGLAGGLSILLALLAALAVIILLLMLVIPNVIQSIIQIVNALPAQIESAVRVLHNLLETYPDLQTSWDEFSSEVVESINAWLQTDLLSFAQALINGLGAQIAGIVTLVKNVFLGLLISIYLLASRKKFAVQARKLAGGIFPRRWAEIIEEEVRYADRMFNGFLVGRVLDSAIIGVICFVFTLIFRFDSCVLVSVIVGVTNIIPVFGPFLGAIPCALILLLENPLHCLIFLIFIVILQQVDGNVIGPRILGETTGVSSFWVLFSVMLFGGLWGILGMIIGVPLFAVIYDIVRKLVYRGLHHHHRDDLLQPVPAQETVPDRNETSDETSDEAE